MSKLTKSIQLAVLVGALVGVTACGHSNDPRYASREDLRTVNATVQTVDMDTRQVLLTFDDGAATTVTAGPEVRNLAQLESGDVVSMTYFEAVTLQMADDDDPGGEATEIDATRADLGEKPGGAIYAVTDAVVEFVSFDENTGLVTFVSPNGVRRTTYLAPELYEFASARRTGDRVEVTIEQAVAVAIIELS